MSHRSALNKSDKEHLTSIARSIDWQRIAVVMNVLNWHYYHIPGRTPNAGELRDGAMEHLNWCIREARTNGHHVGAMNAGGFGYTAQLCPDTGAVLSLYCDFTIEAHLSTEPNPVGR
jgi:hypothetical protein